MSSSEVYIGVHIGTTSASVAYMLSKATEPQMVPLQSSKTIIPLTRKSTKGDNLDYAHSPWNLILASTMTHSALGLSITRERPYLGMGDCREALWSFLQDLVQQLLAHISDTFHKFKETLLKAFLPISPFVKFLTQPEAALLYCLHEDGVEFRGEQDVLVVCHMEEQITVKIFLLVTIHYGIVEEDNQASGTWPSLLLPDIIVLGSEDIEQRLQLAIENELETPQAVSLLEDFHGEEIAKQIREMIDKFHLDLHKLQVESPIRFTLSRNSTENKYTCLSVKISAEIMKEKIFNPVLSVISERMREGIGQILSKRKCDIRILLSGVPGECEYVHKYIEKVQKNSSVVVLDSSDEGTSSSRGAAISLGKSCKRTQLRLEDADAVITEIKENYHRHDVLRAASKELKSKATVALTLADYKYLVRKLDMILWERLRYNPRTICEVGDEFDCLRDIYLAQSSLIERSSGPGQMQNVLKYYGLRPLHTRRSPIGLKPAAVVGSYSDVKLMVEDEIDFLGNGYDLDYILDLAVRSEDLALIRLLLRKGADPNRGALLTAVSQDRLDVVSVLFDEGADINKDISYGKTMVQIAVENGYKNHLRLLIERGANVNSVVSSINGDRKTPTRAAVRAGYAHIVETLLYNRADPYLGSFSALHDAAYFGKIDLVRVLLAYDVDVNRRSPPGVCPGGRQVTPLQSAIACDSQLRRISIIRLLLDHGADVNVLDEEEYTKLPYHTIHGHKGDEVTTFQNASLQRYRHFIERNKNGPRQGSSIYTYAYHPSLQTTSEIPREELPDDKVSSSAREKELRLWAQTGYSHLSYSTDGKLVASIFEQTIIRLLESATGAVRHTFKGHTERVWHVEFSPNGKLVASASADRTVRLWEIATGATLYILEGHTEPIIFVAFSPDSTVLASGSKDYTVRLWDLTTGLTKHELASYSEYNDSIVFSSDGSLVLSESAIDVVIWDSATGAMRHRFEEGGYKIIHRAVFSPNSKLIAAASEGPAIRLLDSNTGMVQYTLEGHRWGSCFVAFSPNGKLVATVPRDNTIKLWDLTRPVKGKARHTLKGHRGSVTVVVFSPDSELLASASWDSTIILWDSSTGVALQTFRGWFDTVSILAFLPDGNLIALAGGHGNVGPIRIPFRIEHQRNRLATIYEP